VATGFSDLGHLRTDPDLASLHREPRFQRLAAPPAPGG
jgi:hypothetical protein